MTKVSFKIMIDDFEDLKEFLIARLDCEGLITLDERVDEALQIIDAYKTLRTGKNVVIEYENNNWDGATICSLNKMLSCKIQNPCKIVKPATEVTTPLPLGT